jgi:hypothetical protein
MQRIADLEAEVAALTAEKQELESKAQGTKPLDVEALAGTIAEVIDARLRRTEQGLREEFVTKFAALFEPIIERTTGRVVRLEEREDEAEDRQETLEERLRRHLDEVGAKFDGLAGMLDAKFVGLSDMLVSHKACTDEALGMMGECLRKWGALAAATVEAAESCQSFKRDYEQTVEKAESDRAILVARMERELGTFAWKLRETATNVIEPALVRAQREARTQFRQRVQWLCVFALGAAVMCGLMWMASPGGQTAMDAAKWRQWQQGFQPAQVERLNRVLAEIEAEKQPLERGRQ